jgi:hypothetical protein
MLRTKDSELMLRLISSFGLETIAESANENSFPMNDGTAWPPAGLDNLILGNAQTNVHQHTGPAIPDFTTMGMGEFLEWSQRTGRTGQYEAYQMGPNGQGSGSGSGSSHGYGQQQAHGGGEEEKRGRQY